MLRAALGPLLLLALVAPAAQADPILYATAATTGEVTSYCIGAGGGLFPSAKQRITTLGNAPSRLITATLPGGQFLYAGENDRVEVYRIADRGFLTRVGRIPARPIPDQPGSGLTGMNPHDLTIATAADGTPVLYVPQRAYDRLASFPLDPATGLSTVPTGVCTTSTPCSSTAECASGQACVADHCVDGSVPCATPAQCGSGQTCRGGVCLGICTPDVAGGCTGAADTCSPISDQTGASCVLGPVPSQWEDTKATSGLLYTTRAVSRGETFVYRLASNGDFADGVVTVSRSIGPETNPTQCPRMRGCTTGATCFVDAGCAAGQRCVSGACVDLSGPECTKNKDCASGQKCVAFSPCNQDGKMYVVPSTDCTAGVVLTDDTGQPITPPATANNPSPNPLTVRGQIEPYARRRRLNGASALVLKDNLLYVSERFRKAISVFSLCPAGGQPPICPDDTTTGEKGEPCTCPDANRDGVPDVPDLCPPGGFSVDAKENADGVCTVRNRQPRLAKHGGRTRSNIRYNAMVLAQGSSASTILGSQFLDGRLDGYRLKSDGRLPRQPTRRTKGNFRTSPFRLFFYRPADLSPAESAGVVYVGAGDIDRVQAYRLDRNGLPKDKDPFSQTDTLADTFPNDVTVAELPGTCP
jgi:hypothetical protein